MEPKTRVTLTFSEKEKFTVILHLPRISQLALKSFSRHNFQRIYVWREYPCFNRGVFLCSARRGRRSDIKRVKGLLTLELEEASRGFFGELCYQKLVYGCFCLSKQRKEIRPRIQRLWRSCTEDFAVYNTKSPSNSFPNLN